MACGTLQNSNRYNCERTSTNEVAQGTGTVLTRKIYVDCTAGRWVDQMDFENAEMPRSDTTSQVRATRKACRKGSSQNGREEGQTAKFAKLMRRRWNGTHGCSWTVVWIQGLTDIIADSGCVTCCMHAYMHACMHTYMHVCMRTEECRTGLTHWAPRANSTARERDVRAVREASPPAYGRHGLWICPTREMGACGR